VRVNCQQLAPRGWLPRPDSSMIPSMLCRKEMQRCQTLIFSLVFPRQPELQPMHAKLANFPLARHRMFGSSLDSWINFLFSSPEPPPPATSGYPPLRTGEAGSYNPPGHSRFRRSSHSAYHQHWKWSCSGCGLPFECRFP